MHEELRVAIHVRNYMNAFNQWIKTNKGKLSIEFDKEIGIGGWKKGTIKIKDEKKFLLAKLKHEL